MMMIILTYFIDPLVAGQLPPLTFGIRRRLFYQLSHCCPKMTSWLVRKLLATINAIFRVKMPHIERFQLLKHEHFLLSLFNIQFILNHFYSLLVVQVSLLSHTSILFTIFCVFTYLEKVWQLLLLTLMFSMCDFCFYLSSFQCGINTFT